MMEVHSSDHRVNTQGISNGPSNHDSSDRDSITDSDSDEFFPVTIPDDSVDSDSSSQPSDHSAPASPASPRRKPDAKSPSIDQRYPKPTRPPPAVPGEPSTPSPPSSRILLSPDHTTTRVQRSSSFEKRPRASTGSSSSSPNGSTDSTPTSSPPLSPSTSPATSPPSRPTATTLPPRPSTSLGNHKTKTSGGVKALVGWGKKMKDSTAKKDAKKDDDPKSSSLDRKDKKDKKSDTNGDISHPSADLKKPKKSTSFEEKPEKDEEKKPSLLNRAMSVRFPKKDAKPKEEKEVKSPKDVKSPKEHKSLLSKASGVMSPKKEEKKKIELEEPERKKQEESPGKGNFLRAMSVRLSRGIDTSRPKSQFDISDDAKKEYFKERQRMKLEATSNPRSYDSLGSKRIEIDSSSDSEKSEKSEKPKLLRAMSIKLKNKDRPSIQRHPLVDTPPRSRMTVSTISPPMGRAEFVKSMTTQKSSEKIPGKDAESSSSTSEVESPKNLHDASSGPSKVIASSSIEELGLQQQVVRATQDYFSQDSQDLTFQVGEMIQVTEIDGANWGRGKSQKTGKTGWFPMAYTAKAESDSALISSMIQGALSELKTIDSSSIVETIGQRRNSLGKRLSARPSRSSLIEANILPKSDSAENYGAVKLAEISKKKEAISVTLNNRTKKDALTHSLSDDSIFTVSRSILNFGGDQTDVGDTISDVVEIKNCSKGKAPFMLRAQSMGPAYSVSIEPATGILLKGKKEKIKISLTVQSLVTMSIPIAIMSKGDTVATITVNLKCKTSIFGVDPSTLPMGTDGVYRIPSILIRIKESLMKHKAFDSEGIFRIAAERSVMLTIRRTMDNGSFQEDDHNFEVANLLKSWLRELPTNLLQKIPDEIFSKEDVEMQWAALMVLDEPERSMLLWLLDLLSECLTRDKKNKMTTDNLAIVFAPSLYNVDAKDPMEGLIATQRVQHFVRNMLQRRSNSIAQSKQML
eukprot:TRINITY_DN560_c0_g3_i2.p1 TRINITY_DN560_c0_g3~~TRINITY_DN560_c0_g3_i2.p1  ORF type:complete len:973 (+),score=313.32 TRINITY_DN560_c0_g3_i2:794-3712(+)